MLRRIAFVLILAALSLAQTTKKPATPSGAGSGVIVLRGGKLLTITHGVIENGVLVMQNGKITAGGQVKIYVRIIDIGLNIEYRSSQ